jgi:hypothetical protein
MKRKKIVPKETTYVEFYFPHSMCGGRDDLVQEVATRDIKKIEVPMGAVGFRFFDIITGVLQMGGYDVNVKSDKLRISPKYMFGTKGSMDGRDVVKASNGAKYPSLGDEIMLTPEQVNLVNK